MTAHLKSCWKQHIITKSGKAARFFHLIVEGHYARDYWLHLQAPADCTFGQLDSLLRAIWLECCNHLSAFEFPVKRPRTSVTPGNWMALRNVWEAEAGIADDELMDETLGSRLQPGLSFFHQYDFGSTTELTLRVAGEYSAPAVKGGLKLLARNEPPPIPCSVCDKPATQLCLECGDYGGLPLCNACARRHECAPEMLSPLVNSPRTGVCGYCGPSVEP